MKQKSLIAAVLALTLLLALTACVKTQSVEPTDVPTEQSSETNSPSTEETLTHANATEETDADAWKVEFEQSLLENYGVVPDYYEYLEDGIYQVYVEINGKVIPYVAVDSATGDYHG